MLYNVSIDRSTLADRLINDDTIDDDEFFAAAIELLFWDIAADTPQVGDLYDIAVAMLN